MKIVIFAPHPDDELVGAGGSILKWKEQGHEIHIIYVSDGRAAYTFERKMGRLIETEATQISEDDLAGVRMKEIDEVINFLKLNEDFIYKFKLPDQQLKDYIEVGKERAKAIIKDSDRILLPCKNSIHEDHQATYKIATTASQEFDLKDVEFYVYAIYVTLKAPKEKRIKINVEDYTSKAHKALLRYESQKYLTHVKDSYEIVRQRKKEKFGIFKLEDIDKYKNF
jgi:LmbE family N-acetylglucosaminyl deacetylase